MSSEESVPVKPNSTKNKTRNQGRKRKWSTSESSNDSAITLPDNTLEMERSLHVSAVKNNLDDISVRKIIKKVVTNDKVLALVKLREVEDSSSENKNVPKLTRAKAKELKKASPKCGAWNLENLELTPIDHIPVKTRPEVKALIAQELPEDEDDEEYEPTNDDVPSDDDHVLESCSDLDSQPRTPATPASHSASPCPRLRRDGPFKVPLDLSTARRRLDIDEEEATIALRTRSKLSLSATSIEHIESNFIPPDDIPHQDVDDVWNEFLNECLNPASVSKNEDDDEADPEYNVAADPDAQDEDEEALGNSIIKISKKELNDLVTELFNIMPVANEEALAENLANSVLTDTSQTEVPKWDGKQEPVSDEEIREQPSKRLTFEKIDSFSRESLGKSEKENTQKDTAAQTDVADATSVESRQPPKEKENSGQPRIRISAVNNKLEISVVECEDQDEIGLKAPPSLRNNVICAPNIVCINMDAKVTLAPEQIQILQQQIRQHVQLATSNFMQLYTHPIHWGIAKTFKEYLNCLKTMADAKEDSVVDVCNLRPALELVTTWETTVSEDTPQNRQMVAFIQNQIVRSRRRTAHNSLYVGEFPDMFKKVVANSSVFLYPYLLPPMPYKPDQCKRYSYLHSEDMLLVLGLDQFWRYVEDNPTIFGVKQVKRQRRGLMITLQLVAKHMFPWTTAKSLAGHIAVVKKAKDSHNPVYKYFTLNEIENTVHKILPFNPSITLYEQPEHEMPRLWLRYLAKTSKRFRNYLMKRHNVTGRAPEGVPIDPGITTATTLKKPLPSDFIKTINRYETPILHTSETSKSFTSIPNPTDLKDAYVAKNLYNLVLTKTGVCLLPVENVNDHDHKDKTEAKPTKAPKIGDKTHCQCCFLIRRFNRKRQRLITDYFSKNVTRTCDCSSVKYPKISDKLRVLVNNHKSKNGLCYKELDEKLKGIGDELRVETQRCDLEEQLFATSYQMKVMTVAAMSRRPHVRKRVHDMLVAFEPDSLDPVFLARRLFKVFEEDMIDLYMDFLGFLTAEQADRLGAFKDYFTRNCAKGLMDQIEKEVSNKEDRNRMLSQLKCLFLDSNSSSCELCSDLLLTMDGYPRLAQYTFSLFPHTNETCRATTTQEETAVDVVKPNEEQRDADETINTVNETQRTADYEADHSSSGEDSDAMSIDLNEEMQIDENADVNARIKTESPARSSLSDELAVEQSANNNPIEEPTVEDLQPLNPLLKDPLEGPSTNNKFENIEIQGDESVTSDCELQTVKTETNEWKREDDKVVLEVLREALTKEEIEGKTISDLLEGKNVYAIIAESLTHKSIDDIKERVSYMLSLIVLSDVTDGR